MLDFIFFHQKPYALFIEKLDALNLSYSIFPNAQDSQFEIQLDEDLPDEILEEIEAIYDQLLDINQQLIEEEEGRNPDNYQLSSIAINLADGRVSHAQIASEKINKILQVLSPEEFAEVVSAIADAVENPDSRSLCQQVRDGDIDFK